MRRIPFPARVNRAAAIGLTVAAIALLGFGLSRLPPLFHVPAAVEQAAVDPATSEAVPAVVSAAGSDPAPDPRKSPQGHAVRMREQELKKRFDEAVAMLHARQYEYAVASLHRVLELSPRLPEAHVNMGFALVGLGDFAAARDFFAGAIELNPRQANAYYGLGVAYEGLGDLPLAVGAMRSYLHLSEANASHRDKARAALWEWEQRRAQERAAPEPKAAAAKPEAPVAANPSDRGAP